ncbi:uncharacterized protein METZ01_LOCUS166632 [marine metagenome]|uniref:Monooxygenase component MmoB/DmpM n=1 Tax=marine metagenome TaxID=408172 RepID=A0A382BIX4_9ZZZZ
MENNFVGPVLRMSDDIDAIISAIHEDNPDKEIEVTDEGAYVRIQAENRLELKRVTVEKSLYRDYEMRELETILSAFAGRLKTTTESFVWYFKEKL